jgi:hypothetical protein
MTSQMRASGKTKGQRGRLWHHSHNPEEQGAVMIMVVIFSAVLMLGALLAAAAEASTNDTATRAEISTQAQAAAEAGLSQAEAAIANPANASSLPCSVQGTVPATSTGGTDTYQATITYYASQSGGVPQGAPIPCSSPPTVQSAGAALISSTGTSQIGIQTSKQVIDEVVSITPQILGGYAIYSGGNLKLTNSDEVLAGSVFVNGSLNSCNSSAQIQGNVVVTGQAVLTNGCTITGNLWAEGGASVTTASPTLDGNAYVTGNLTFSNPGYPGPQFHQNAYVTGSISDTSGNSISTNIAGQAVANTTVNNPPTPPTPIFTWNPTQWTQAGYQIVQYVVPNPTTSACGSYYGVAGTGLPPYPQTSGVYTALFYPNGQGGPISKATNPLVLYTNCPIDLYSNPDLQLAHDFAIVDTACLNGTNPCIIFNNQTTFTSANGQAHQLSVMVPWEAGRTCPTGQSSVDIQVNNAATVQPPLVALFYTQCGASFTNNTSFSGELVGSQLYLSSDFQLTAHPDMLVPGIANQINMQVLTRYPMNEAA